MSRRRTRRGCAASARHCVSLVSNERRRLAVHDAYAQPISVTSPRASARVQRPQAVRRLLQGRRQTPPKGRPPAFAVWDLRERREGLGRAGLAARRREAFRSWTVPEAPQISRSRLRRPCAFRKKCRRSRQIRRHATPARTGRSLSPVRSREAGRRRVRDRRSPLEAAAPVFARRGSER